MTTQEALAKYRWVYTRLVEHRPEATEVIEAARLAVVALEEQVTYRKPPLVLRTPRAASKRSGFSQTYTTLLF